MKHDRIDQLQSRAYGASMSNDEKAEFWDVHNWWQSLSEEEKRAEVNMKKRPVKIIAEMRKRRNQSKLLATNLNVSNLLFLLPCLRPAR